MSSLAELERQLPKGVSLVGSVGDSSPSVIDRLKRVELERYFELERTMNMGVAGSVVTLIVGAIGICAASTAIAGGIATKEELPLLNQEVLTPAAVQMIEDIDYGIMLCFIALGLCVILLAISAVLIALTASPVASYWGDAKKATTFREAFLLSEKRARIVDNVCAIFIGLAVTSLALVITAPVAMQWAGLDDLYQATLVRDGQEQLAPESARNLYSASYGLLVTDTVIGLLASVSLTSIAIGYAVGAMKRVGTKGRGKAEYLQEHLTWKGTSEFGR